MSINAEKSLQRKILVLKLLQKKYYAKYLQQNQFKQQVEKQKNMLVEELNSQLANIAELQQTLTKQMGAAYDPQQLQYAYSLQDEMQTNTEQLQMHINHFQSRLEKLDTLLISFDKQQRFYQKSADEKQKELNSLKVKKELNVVTEQFIGLKCMQVLAL